MEVAGRSGAVDHDPVAIIELAYLKVLGECLGGQCVAERWPTYGTQAVALPSTADVGSTHRVGIRVIIAHLQESLRPRRGVLWTLKANARWPRLA